MLYRWGQDPASHPIVVVDNNLDTFTDPATGGRTQTDRFAADATNGTSGNVYVAWDTVDANPTAINNFNPNAIKLVVSSDGGNQFGAVRTLNDGGNQTTRERNTTPRLVVSQGRLAGTLSAGDAGVPGGQVTIVWDDFDGLNTPPCRATPSRSTGSRGASAGRPPTTRPSATLTTSINDAVAPASGNHIPAVTLFDLPVDFPDAAKFTDTDVITDLDVTLSINHSAINELQIRLIPPPAAAWARSRCSTTGPTPPAPAPTTSASPVPTWAGAGAPSGTFPGTIFDAESYRSITNNAGGAASVGRFLPDGPAAARRPAGRLRPDRRRTDRHLAVGDHRLPRTPAPCRRDCGSSRSSSPPGCPRAATSRCRPAAPRAR